MLKNNLSEECSGKEYSERRNYISELSI